MRRELEGIIDMKPHVRVIRRALDGVNIFREPELLFICRGLRRT